MEPYRAGIVGLGNVGFLFDLDARTRRRYAYPTHGSAYTAHPRTELAAVCDRKPSRVEEASRWYGVSRGYTDVEDMLGKEELEILSVCVPPEEQGGVVQAAIRRGVPLIFCEKPFTTSSGEAGALLDQARARTSSVVVNYWRRFDPCHREIKQRIRGGRIGVVQQIRGIYGNGLRNVGSHAIDLALWYVGPARGVVGVDSVKDNPLDPGLEMLVEFADGVRGAFGTCSYAHYRIFEFDILGSEGRICVSNEGLDIRCYGVQENEDVSGARQLSTEPTFIPSTVGNAMYHGIDHLVSVLDRSQRVFADHAVETHRVLEAARRSAASGGMAVAP